MVSRNDQYFYLSGALSFALFGAVVILFAYALLSSDKVKTYALKKDNYIAVSIQLPTEKRSTATVKKPEPKPLSKPKAEPKPSEKPQATPDVSSLFSNVWTQKVSTKPAKKETTLDTKRLTAIEKRIKTTESTKSEAAKEKIKTLEFTRPSIELVGSTSSSAAEVNEFLAKIQAFVYDQFYPPLNSEGNSAKVRIWLDGSGRMTDYRVLAYSGSSSFNEEVDRLKKRLEGVRFPKHPQAKPTTINIILTAEE